MPVYRIHGKSVLFIHVPKTGGTSVENFLRQHGPEGLHSRGAKLVKPAKGSALSSHVPLQHFHAELLQAVFPQGYFDYAFMIVRDPVARLRSAYMHSRELGRPEGQLTFDHWTRLMLPLAARLPYLRNNHLRPQAEFECFGAQVFRFEEGVDSIIGRVAERLGLAAPEVIPHARRGAPAPGEVTPGLQARIWAHFRQDFEKYGY